MRSKAAGSMPETVVQPETKWLATPVPNFTCGSSSSFWISLIGRLERPTVPTRESGDRTMMSAPMPRVRCEESSTKPWLSPTNVNIRVTGMAISRTLRKVLIGRWLRFARISLLITLLSIANQKNYSVVALTLRIP
jgi:hypothetical protein